MTYGYYPGCSLESMSIEYDVSLRNVFDRLQIQLEQIPGWICCGTLAAPSTSRLLGLATPLSNVARAAQAGYEEVITPCSACLYHSRSALHQLHQNPSLVPQIESILDLPLDKPAHFGHRVELLGHPEFAGKIKSAIVNDLPKMQVVCYYGCLMTRPLNLCHKILKHAQAVGAQAIVVDCPMCQIKLDSRQADIQARYGDKFDLPILYFTQLLGFWRHVVEPSQIMQCVEDASDPAARRRVRKTHRGFLQFIPGRCRKTRTRPLTRSISRLQTRLQRFVFRRGAGNPNVNRRSVESQAE